MFVSAISSPDYKASIFLAIKTLRLSCPLSKIVAKFEGSIREFAWSDKMKPRKSYARTLSDAAEVSAGYRRNASQIHHRLSQMSLY
jgi:hypothetical protein